VGSKYRGPSGGSNDDAKSSASSTGAKKVSGVARASGAPSVEEQPAERRSRSSLACEVRGADQPVRYRQARKEQTNSAEVHCCSCSHAHGSPPLETAVGAGAGSMPPAAAAPSAAAAPPAFRAPAVPPVALPLRKQWSRAGGHLPPLSAPDATGRWPVLEPEQLRARSAVARMAADYWKQENRASPRILPESAPASRVPSAASNSTSAGSAGLSSARESSVSSTSGRQQLLR